MSKLVDINVAIDAICNEWCGVSHKDCKHPFNPETDDYYWCDGCETVLDTLPNLPSAESVKAHTKADYIMALHKEYGCTLARAEEAHNKALEYLRSKAMMKG